MSSEKSKTEKKGEPSGRVNHVPEWLVILFGLLIFVGMMYLDRYGGGMDPRVYEPYDSFANVKEHWPKTTMDPDVAEGKQYFTMFCAPCHQQSGLGATGVAPPLVGSEWVLAEGPNRIIRIVLNGLQGPVEVKGQEWNLVMMAWKDMLSNRQIATILTYIRQNPEWEGHNASKVTEEQVAAIRQATQSRMTSWTASELSEIPVQ